MVSTICFLGTVTPENAQWRKWAFFRSDAPSDGESERLTANWWRNSGLLRGTLVKVSREPKSLRLDGCARSLEPTRLYLEFREMQGDSAKLQGYRRFVSAESPCVSMHCKHSP
jgi:hypothetical protein